MRILQVVSFFKPSWEAGGTARVCYEQSTQLVARGHNVTVYTTDGFKRRLKVKKNTPLSVDGITVYYFRNLSNILARTNICIPYFLPFIAKKDIQHYDIIHMHTLRGLNALPIWYYAKKYKVPYVLQAHGSTLTFNQKGKFKRIYDYLVGYRIMRDAKKVIALTKTEADQYSMIGIDKNQIEIIPNGNTSFDYENLPEKGKFRSKYKIDDNKKIILFAGRLHESKGIDLLVKSFYDINHKLSDSMLVLLGPNDGYLQELQDLITSLELNDKIILTGFVSNEEKLETFIDANVFVTPSFSGFPVTFLEVCSCGVPLVTTKKGDELDWINENVGYVVEYDQKQLTDAIFKILNDRELATSFGNEGRRLTREEFTWNNIIIKVENLYDSCIFSKSDVNLK